MLINSTIDYLTARLEEIDEEEEIAEEEAEPTADEAVEDEK
jgi:hypothetical protein